jgi:hypothetical protein
MGCPELTTISHLLFAAYTQVSPSLLNRLLSPWGRVLRRGHHDKLALINPLPHATGYVGRKQGRGLMGGEQSPFTAGEPSLNEGALP